MQHFQPHHYAAFDEPKPNLNDLPTVHERELVRDALLELDAQLSPYIETTGWDLHPHRQRQHFVSSHRFVFLDDGTPIVNHIDGMWLHYGKSPEQLDFLRTMGGYDYKFRDDDDYFNAFYLHTRIQFYLNASVFRCWLLLATDKNYYDRSEYLKRLAREPSMRNDLFQSITPLLGKSFFYEIDDERLDLSIDLSQEKLLRFVRKDRGEVYSGIVKEYDPNDPNLDLDNISDEMIANLEYLYPIYDLMAWRPPAV